MMRCDVLVVGGGLAAMAAVLEASGAGARVAWAPGGAAASELAQGGLAAAVGPDDDAEQHRADTERAGAGLCDPEAVGALTAAAPGAVAWLESQGARFDRLADGRPALALEAAHSRPRVLHANGDGSGAALVAALRQRVAGARVSVLEDAWLQALLVGAEGVGGARLRRGGSVVDVRAAATVLATGGYAGLFPRTATTPDCSGQGLVVALLAGAELADLEFVQFHPTVYAGPGGCFLLTEALRGAGAHVVDEAGRRFLFDADPRGELAPRSVVARAISTHLSATGQPHVFLDARPVGGRALGHEFPGFLARCRAVGLDPLVRPVPVAPAAHYTMGGIVTDGEGATAVPGLLAAGECARTGVHGANRLASNSLLEAVVFGRHAGRAALARAPRLASARAVVAAEAGARGGLELGDVRQAVGGASGPLRDAAGLGRGLRLLEADAGRDAGAEHARVLARLVLAAALRRRESRGAHVRTDHPEPVPAWAELQLTARLDATVGPVLSAEPRVDRIAKSA